MIDCNTKSFATYMASTILDYGQGNLEGDIVGGAKITDGKLDLTGGIPASVTYDALNNFDVENTFTIKLKVTPNFSGTPVNTYPIWAMWTSTDRIALRGNVVELSHSSTLGKLNLFIYKPDGTLAATAGAVSWFPTAGIEYVITVVFKQIDDLNVKVSIFLDDEYLAVPATIAINRGASQFFAFGASIDGAVTNVDYSVDDVVVTDTADHDEPHDSAYSLPATSQLITLTGFFSKIGCPHSGLKIKVRPYIQGDVNEELFTTYEWDTLSPTNSSGFLLDKIYALPDGDFTEFKIGSQRYKAIVPDQEFVDFWDLDLSLVED